MRHCLITLCLLLALPALSHAAELKSQLTIVLGSDGVADVVDRWTGLGAAEGTYNYFSATRELGEIPVTIHDHGFTLRFSTPSWLHHEGELYILATPDFYSAEGPLDVELALSYPPDFVLTGVTPEPAYNGDGVLQWSLADCVHRVVIARFKRSVAGATPAEPAEPAAALPDPDGCAATMPLPDGSAATGDGSVSSRPAQELPPATNATPAPTGGPALLEEFDTVLKLAESSTATDPDFLKVLAGLIERLRALLLEADLLSTAPPETLDHT